MAHAGRLVRNTAVNGAAAVVSTAISIAVTSLLLGAWGSDRYGLWMMVLMMSFDRGYLGLLDFGHGTAALQQLVSASPDQRRRIRWELRRRYLLFSLVGIALIIAIGRLVLGSLAEAETGWTLWAMALTMCLRLPIDMQHAANVVVLESKSRYVTIRMIELAGSLAWLGVAIVASVRGLTVLGAAVGYLAIGVGQSLMSMLALRSDFKDENKAPVVDVDGSISLWANGKWVALQRLTGIVYAHMDRLIIAFAVGLGGVGEYEIPYKIQALGVLILSTLPSAVFPVAAQLKSETDREALVNLYHRGTRLSVAMCVPPLLALVFLARPLVLIWVGRDYLHLVTSVQLFTSWTFLAVFHVVGVMMLAATGRNRENFLLSLGAVLLNLPLSVWLGSSWGIEGVITGTLVGYAVIFIPTLVIEQQLFGDGVRRWFGEVIKPMMIPVLVEIALLLWMRSYLGDSPQVLLTGMIMLISTLAAWGLYFLVFAAEADTRLLRSLVGGTR